MPKTKLYTMLLRDRITGREEILYRHTSENFIQQFGIPYLEGHDRFVEGDWELVVRPWKGYKCDWSHCPGDHSFEDNYCFYEKDGD